METEVIMFTKTRISIEIKIEIGMLKKYEISVQTKTIVKFTTEIESVNKKK